MTSNRVLGAGLAILIATAGMAAGVSAQDTGRGRTPDSREVQGARKIDQPEFRSAKWLEGREVRNDNGEHVASIGDMILDRGSGRIDYVVLKTGTILGMGGNRVALSYASLRWDPSAEHFVLPLTPEQLKQYPEFNEDEWKGVTDTNASAKTLRQRLMTDASKTAGDPYGTSVSGAKALRVKGEVTKVERVRNDGYGEQVVLTVKTEDGERRVALGPSWFVNSGAFAPMRGDQVTIEAVALARDPEKTVVAKTMRVGDRDLVLRTEEGSPAWAVTAEETPEQRSRAARRYLLLSTLLGARVDCRGSECGKVYDVILERDSGGLAFLSIDPNQNFLGIADTKRLVPWSVVSVASDGVARIDASKEMVLASPETPSDIATLNSSGVGGLVYKAYDVEAPKFEAAARPTHEAPAMAGAEAWSRNGTICKAIRKDSARTVTGKSAGVTDVTFEQGIPDARAITVNEDGKEVLVLLGPAWYMKNQKLPCDADTRVTIQTYRTTIAGKDYLIARSIDCGGTRVDLLDGTGSPAWDRSK
jgi:sporulation protein YlmC with PRC-barrel domain